MSDTTQIAEIHQRDFDLSLRGFVPEVSGRIGPSSAGQSRVMRRCANIQPRFQRTRKGFNDILEVVLRVTLSLVPSAIPDLLYSKVTTGTLDILYELEVVLARLKVGTAQHGQYVRLLLLEDETDQ